MVVWITMLNVWTALRQPARWTARGADMARGLIIAAFGAALAGPVAVATADSFRELQIAYRCELVGRLERIAATGDPTIARDRFLAVSVARRPQIYVQCMFHDANTMALCEAASGFYLSKPDEPRKVRASERTIAALAQLGFDTDDSAGNFRIDRAVGTPPDFNALADFILRALHDGYGVRGVTELTFSAPFAPGTPTSCLAVS